jgi:hypothetical protein
MTKKIDRLEDYISAKDAAFLLTKKLGRPISPKYIYKLKGVRFHIIHQTSKLYHKGDIQAVNIRKKKNNGNNTSHSNS